VLYTMLLFRARRGIGAGNRQVEEALKKLGRRYLQSINSLHVPRFYQDMCK
jgi:hypothetical protein